MFDKNEVPSTNTLGRAVLYLFAVVLLGMSFSFTMELMNEVFVLGAAGTMVNVFLSLMLVRYVATTHFTNQDS